MNTQNLIKSALIGAMTFGAVSIATAAPASNATSGKMNMQKCYGINAAYKNDCQSPGHSCAGQDSKARDPNAFVAVPTGLCQKIDGGSIKPASKS